LFSLVGYEGVRTYVVVGVAVAVLSPVIALSIDEHRSVTFASHPFNCSASITPSGLTSAPAIPPDSVDVAVSVVVGYADGSSPPFAMIQLAQSRSWV
jgi:hypothetical protein